MCALPLPRLFLDCSTHRSGELTPPNPDTRPSEGPVALELRMRYSSWVGNLPPVNYVGEGAIPVMMPNYKIETVVSSIHTLMYRALVPAASQAVEFVLTHSASGSTRIPSKPVVAPPYIYPPLTRHSKVTVANWCNEASSTGRRDTDLLTARVQIGLSEDTLVEVCEVSSNPTSGPGWGPLQSLFKSAMTAVPPTRQTCSHGPGRCLASPLAWTVAQVGSFAYCCSTPQLDTRINPSPGGWPGLVVCVDCNWAPTYNHP